MLSGTSNKRTTWKSRAGGGDGTVSGTVGDGFCSTLKLNCFCRRLRKLRFNGFLQNSKAIITLCKCNSLTVSGSVSSAVSRAKRQFKGCLMVMFLHVCVLSCTRAGKLAEIRPFFSERWTSSDDRQLLFFLLAIFFLRKARPFCA